jgi:hypothetical protein
MAQEKDLEFMKYLQGQDDTKERDKLSLFKEMGASNSDPIGRLVHSLIMMKLMKSANREEKGNQEKRATLFAQHQDRKFSEAKMLEQLKLEIEAQKEAKELAKEERQAKRQDKRDTVVHNRELEKESRRAAQAETSENKKRVFQALSKSFAPGSTDEMEYLLDPKDAEKRRKTKDVNPWYTKAFGYAKKKVGGTYTPKMQSYLERK